MKNEKNEICSVCGKAIARTTCDHCGAPLCRECCKLEIWGSGAEDLSARYFCPACKEDPAANPWGAHYNIEKSEKADKPVLRKAKGVIKRDPVHARVYGKTDKKRKAS